MSGEPSGLFARWSLRRKQVEDENRLADVTEQPAAEIASEEVVEPELTVSEVTDDAATAPEPVLGAEDLPDPESIEEGGSFALFMGKNIDPKAKQLALRALWKQPHYSELDGMLEYGLDYSNQPVLSADTSAELVGKVYRHVVKEVLDDEGAETEQMASLAHGSAAGELDIVSDDVALDDSQAIIVDDSGSEAEAVSLATSPEAVDQKQ